jgi:hypothetical protein
VVYFFVIVFAMLAISLCLTSATTVGALLRDRPRARFALEATWAAQGGIEAARAGLALDPACTEARTEIGRGTAEVTVRAVPGAADLRDVVSVASVTGPGVGNVVARQRIEVRLRLGTGLPQVVSWHEGP